MDNEKRSSTPRDTNLNYAHVSNSPPPTVDNPQLQLPHGDEQSDHSQILCTLPAIRLNSSTPRDNPTSNEKFLHEEQQQNSVNAHTPGNTNVPSTPEINAASDPNVNHDLKKDHTAHSSNSSRSQQFEVTTKQSPVALSESSLMYPDCPDDHIDLTGEHVQKSPGSPPSFSDINDAHQGQPGMFAPTNRNVVTSFDLDEPVSTSQNMDITFDEREVEIFLTPCAQRGNRKSDVPPIGKRVQIEQMSIVENPLEKDGRNTVIKGRLSDDSPYAEAATSLGAKLFCFKQGTETNPDSEEEARSNHLKDVFSFGIMTRGKKMKVPVIGGDHLNVYKLQREVLLLGGVKNVVENRAFRIVAQQLELPGSCTSAAYVLKGTYERYLYHYEQLIVFGRWPKRPNEVINMKSIVNEGRELQAKVRAKQKSTAVRARRALDFQLQTEKQLFPAQAVPLNEEENIFSYGQICQEESPPPPGVSSSNAETLKKFMAISSAAPTKTWNLYCILTAESVSNICLPHWALHFPLHGAYEKFLTTAEEVDANDRLTSACDIILLAVAECFCQSDDENKFVGLGLARLICCFSSKVRNGRESQALLFVLLSNMLDHSMPVELATATSGGGLLDGLFAVIHNQCQSYGKRDNSSNTFLQDSAENTKDQDEAACFCALQVLQGLAMDRPNCMAILGHKFFVPVCSYLLCFDSVPRYCVRSILYVIFEGGKLLWCNLDMDAEMLVARALLSKLEQSSAFEGTKPITESCVTGGLPDFEISSLVLNIFREYLSTISEPNSFLFELVSVLAKLLHSLHRLNDVSALSNLCCDLSDKFPDLVSGTQKFLLGLLELMREEEYRDSIVSCLSCLYMSHPSAVHKDMLMSMCVHEEVGDTWKGDETTPSAEAAEDVEEHCSSQSQQEHACSSMEGNGKDQNVDEGETD